jgi:hypothetical protein
MSKRNFELYSWIAPLVLAPLSFWLWFRSTGSLRLTLLAWLIPIVWAYIVPGIGTNVLKVWEFDTRLRLGRFRPHHGFVFGSATAMLAWLCHGTPAQGWGDVARSAMVLASVLGFWNLLYEVRALRSGILRVYTQPWADGLPAESIAFDYAPWFFAGFGACQGAGFAAGEWLAHRGALTRPTFIGLFLATFLAAILVPLLLYRWHAFRTHGHSGCRPVRPTP